MQPLNDKRQPSERVSNVLDAFIARIALEMSDYNQTIVNFTLKDRQITAKEKKKGTKMQLMNFLSRYPNDSTAMNALTPSFVQIASGDVTNSILICMSFFPELLGGAELQDISERSLLSYFQLMKKPSSETYAVIGFISEVMFATLVSELLLSTSSLKADIVAILLDRLFRAASNEDASVKYLEITRIALRHYRRMLSRLCHFDFHLTSTRFNTLFVNKRLSTSRIVLLCEACMGFSFSQVEFPIISGSIEYLAKLLNQFKYDGVAINALCSLLAQLADQMGFPSAMPIINKIYSKTSKILKLAGAWSNSLRLIGVIHYLVPQKLDEKYIKFFDRFVDRRLRKPHKIEGALLYLDSSLRPSSRVGLNWSAQTGRIVDFYFKRLFKVSLCNHEKTAASILVNMAALDLPSFVNEWLPSLLNHGTNYISVVFLALQKIFNPASGFQELAKAAPTNATVGVTRLVNNVVDAVVEFVYSYLPKFEPVLSLESVHFMPYSEISKGVIADSDRFRLNTLPIHPISLTFILQWEDHLLVSPCPAQTSEIINNAEKVNVMQIESLKSHFDAYHTSFGDILERRRPVFASSNETALSECLAIIPLLPILFHYTSDVDRLVNPLVKMLFSDIPLQAALASTIFQILVISYPNKAMDCLLLLAKYADYGTEEQTYSILLTYLYSIQQMRDVFMNNYIPVARLSEYMAVLALSSPYPETRVLSLRILEITNLFRHFAGDSKLRLLYDVLNSNSSSWMYAGVGSLISCFTTDLISVPKIEIDYKEIIASPFYLFWLCFFSEFSKFLVEASFTDVVIQSRNYFISSPHKIGTMVFLISSTLTMHHNIPPNLVQIYRSQTLRIISLLPAITENFIADKYGKLAPFVISCVHLDSLQDVAEMLVSKTKNKNETLLRKEKVLLLISLMIRRASVRTEFESYYNKYLNSGFLKSMSDYFDQHLNSLIILNGPEHYRMLFLVIEQITNILIFYGRHYKSLFISRLGTSNSPLPRCATCTGITDEDISRICSKTSLFENFFKWSLIDVKNGEFGHDPDCSIAMATTEKQATFNQLESLSRAASIALSHLAPLSSRLAPNKLNSVFLLKAAKIASKRPSFLLNFLTTHFKIVYSLFIETALVSPIETAVHFLKAIAAQFLVPTVNNSVYFSHDSFLRSLTSAGFPRNTGEDREYVYKVYSQAGSLTLLCLLFMLHDDPDISQSSLKTMIQVLPIILVLHSGGSRDNATSFLRSIREVVPEMSTQYRQHRLKSVLKISSISASHMAFATEQLLRQAFLSFPSTFLERDTCNRMDIFMIITPWLRNIALDLDRRLTVRDHSRFFVFFSPFSLINDLISCLSSVSEVSYSSAHEIFEFWKASPITRMPIYVTESMLTSAISSPNLSNYVRRVLSMSSRFMPQIHDHLVSFLNVDFWQFCTFSKYSNSYAPRIKLVLDILRDISEDNVSSLFPCLPDITAFCLTHMNDHTCISLMRSIVTHILCLLDINIPDSLHTLKSLLDAVPSVPAESLRLKSKLDSVEVSKEEDHRLKVLPVYTVYKLFAETLSSLDPSFDGFLTDNLYRWGVICGDLSVSATALELMSDMKPSKIAFRNILDSILSVCKVVSDTVFTSNACKYVAAGFTVLSSVADLPWSDEAMEVALRVTRFPKIGEDAVVSAFRFIVKRLENSNERYNFDGCIESASTVISDVNSIAEFTAAVMKSSESIGPVVVFIISILISSAINPKYTKSLKHLLTFRVHTNILSDLDISEKEVIMASQIIARFFDLANTSRETVYEIATLLMKKSQSQEVASSFREIFIYSISNPYTAKSSALTHFLNEIGKFDVISFPPLKVQEPSFVLNENEEKILDFIPTDPDFTESEYIQRLTALHYGVKIEPYSSWFEIIESTQEMTELRARHGERPILRMDESFTTIMSDLVSIVIDNEENEVEAETKPFKINREVSLSEYDGLTEMPLFTLDPHIFLPVINLRMQDSDHFTQK